MSFADIVNELKLSRADMLESRIESTEDFKTQLTYIDIQNNILTSIRDSVKSIASSMVERSTRMSDALEEQNKLMVDAALRERLEKQGIDRARVTEPRLPADDRLPQIEIGGILGQMLGLIKGLVLGGVAAVLGSELWLNLRGMASGEEYRSLSNEIQSFATAVVAFSGVFANLSRIMQSSAAKVSSSILAFLGTTKGLIKITGTMGVALGGLLKLSGPLIKTIGIVGTVFSGILSPFRSIARGLGGVLRVIPGLGQAIMVITAAFDGIRAGFLKWQEGGNILAIAIATARGVFDSVINGFLSIPEIFGVDMTQIKGSVKIFFDKVFGVFDQLIRIVDQTIGWIARKSRGLLDAITTSDAEQARNEKQAEIDKLLLSRSGRRRRTLTAEQLADIDEKIRVARLDLERLQSIVEKEDAPRYIEPQHERSRGKNIGELANNVDQKKRAIPIVNTVVTDASTNTNTQIQNNNTQLLTPLRTTNDSLHIAY